MALNMENRRNRTMQIWFKVYVDATAINLPGIMVQLAFNATRQLVTPDGELVTAYEFGELAFECMPTPGHLQQLAEEIRRNIGCQFVTILKAGSDDNQG